MALKMVNSIQAYVNEGTNLRGLERKPFGEPGSFYDMENMSGAHWPVLKTRGKRRKLRAFDAFGGFFGHEGAGWVDNGEVWWNGAKVCDITPGKKRIVEIGAQAVIFPDKYMFNMETGEHKSLENRVEVTDGVITYEPCELSGDVISFVSAVYVKVSCPGIGAGFNEDDVVYMSGSRAIPEGYYQIYTVTEDSFLILATLEAQSVTETALTVERLVPDMDFVTESDNRLWGCSSEAHEVYCCALGDPTNWRKYQGLANDSYVVTIGTPGDFTGAATHLGYVLFFKEDVIHKVFGNRPSNYQVTTVHARGVEKGSSQSLCMINETLYYKSRTGMVSYEGSLPDDIGVALGYGKMNNVVSGANNRQMWVSAENGDGGHDLYVYDGWTGYWYREDDSAADGFLSEGGSVYMAKDGALWLIDGDGDERLEDESAEDEDEVEWMAETGDLDMVDLYKRHLQKIMVRMRVTDGAECRIRAQYDDGEWVTLKTVEGKDDKKALSVALIPRRCDHMRLRLEGTGQVNVVAISYSVWAGSELG